MTVAWSGAGGMVCRLEAADVAATAGCIEEVFCGAEPMLGALGVTPDAFAPDAAYYAARGAASGLSRIARQAEGGEIIGFRLCEDWCAAEPDAAVPDDSPTAPIAALLARCQAIYGSRHIVRSGEVLHFLMTGVRAGWRGQGVAAMMQRAVLAMARDCGYRRVVCEATGPISQRMFLGLGFCEVGRVDYAGFDYRGQRPFAALAGIGGCLVLEATLQEITA